MWLVNTFVEFKVPKRLQSKPGEGGSKYYSVYRVVATLMYMNQPYDQIMKLDIIQALTYIQAYGKVTSEPKKKAKH